MVGVDVGELDVVVDVTGVDVTGVDVTGVDVDVFGGGVVVVIVVLGVVDDGEV